MSQLVKLLGVFALAAMATINLSCDVKEYCLNCAHGDGGFGGDGGGDAADDGGVDPDADAGPCVPTNGGTETCDGKDNDCNGTVDDGTLPGVGAVCANQVGECAGGTQQCVDGALRCDKPPMPEACDLKDNDCDGEIDDGDPGGGAVCGTNTGECVAGAYRCNGGVLECVGAIGTVGGQPELCNNRDDDCDGRFDEDLTLGPCVAGVDGPTEGNTGACKLGVRQCVGGTTVCVGAVFPTFELCDDVDQDCDGYDANGYTTDTDPQNCGACGTVCDLANAFEGCENSTCTVLACAPNFFNNDGDDSTGCEFDCGHPFLGNEVCNGVDDDCDGLIDEMDPDLVAPVGICLSLGACSTMTELQCTGAGGWTCKYNNPNVQKDVLGNILPETQCDGDIVAGTEADNDCDGRIDEAQANVGVACDNGGTGDCRNTGAFACDPDNRDGAAVCTYTVTGPGMQPAESCDNRDNDCDGDIDEGADTGDLAGQEWVSIPNLGVEIMKYEASRPDATATAGGGMQAIACSRPGVQPWTNITYPQAEAACDAIGARLCTEAEWQSMCVPSTAYPTNGVPVPLTTDTTEFVFIEAEDYDANTTIPAATPARAWTRIAPPSLHGVTAMQVPDNNFSVTTAANALADSSRLDYRLDLAAMTSYRVWMRVLAPATASLSPYGVHTAPVAGTTATSDASTQVGDLIVAITWTPDGDGVPTHTAANGFTQIFSNDNNDGSTDTRLSAAYFVATTAGEVAYTPYTSSKTPSYTGLIVLKAGRYDLSGLFSASTDWDDNTNVNPPDANTTGGGTFAVLAIGGWHLGTGADASITPPQNFTEAWEMTGSNQGELSVALGSNDNPGSFGDNVTQVGGSAGTVAIRLIPSTNNGVWVGLTAGGTAGNANATAVSATAVDQWQWVVSPQLTSGAAGLHTFSVYTQYDGMIIDTIAISRQSAAAPTFDYSWAYQTSPRTAQPQTCNADDYDTDPVAAGDQDGILATGALPMCFANQSATAQAFDMTGNVKEWTAARAEGQNPLRGGASNNEVPGTTCKLDFTLANDAFFFPNVGFRCCR